MNKVLRKMVAIILTTVMITNIIPQIVFADENRDAVGDDVATVRVYFSISDDSEFMVGNDDGSRVMARVPIDVPYVDLAEYGLEDFYRYEAKPFEEGGAYNSTVVVEWPTLLMCFLKGLSQYYLGREITASDISYSAQYSGEGQSKTLTANGGATSLYLLWFWGHFYNFMYFVNHQYPLMAPGWGATADYILLEDGDEIDVGMFSDTRFNLYGGFAYFDSGNMTITAGDSVDMTLYLTKSQYSGGSDYNGTMNKEPIRVSSDYGRTWQTKVYTTDKQGTFTATFDEAGVYYVSAGPVFKNQPYTQLQCITPPICVVEVKPAPVTNGKASISNDKINLSWDATPGAEEYEIRYQNVSGETKTMTTTETNLLIADADMSGCSFSITPYVTDEYVAMGEPYKTLKGKSVTVAFDTEGEARKELAEAKAQAKEELATYMFELGLNNYRDVQQEELTAILTSGNDAIDAAENKAAVVDALASAKAAMDQVKTDAELTQEEAEARMLAEAKQTAITNLQSYKSPDLYREAEQASLASIIESGTAAINAASTIEAVQTAYSEAVSSIDGLKTKAQYEAEEQGQGGEDDPDAKALDEAKATAKIDLAAYKDSKDLTLYRDVQKRELAQLVEQGNAAIDAAQTIDAVTQALSDAKTALDAVKTDAQLTEEEAQAAEEAAKKLKEAKSNAKVELGLYMAPSEYREAEKVLLLEILSEGEAAIDDAETEEAVKALLAEYKAKIDELKTDAEYTAEEEAARKEEERKQKEHEAAVCKAKIKAAKAAKSNVTAKALKKHKAKVTWKKVALSYTVDGKKYTGKVTGYKVYRATKKKGKYKLVKTIRKAKTCKYVDKKLKKGRKYFYKVRTYTMINGKTYLGKWSKAAVITAK